MRGIGCEGAEAQLIVGGDRKHMHFPYVFRHLQKYLVPRCPRTQFPTQPEQTEQPELPELAVLAELVELRCLGVDFCWGLRGPKLCKVGVELTHIFETIGGFHTI